MCNDHTDAEYARRELAYEMGGDGPEDARWNKWSAEVEKLLIDAGVTDEATGLDGGQTEDGFSIDFAYDSFLADFSVLEYVAMVLEDREEMGL